MISKKPNRLLLIIAIIYTLFHFGINLDFFWFFNLILVLLWISPFLAKTRLFFSIVLYLLFFLWAMGMTASLPTEVPFWLILIPLYIFLFFVIRLVLKLKDLKNILINGDPLESIEKKRKKVKYLSSISILFIGLFLFLFFSFGTKDLQGWDADFLGYRFTNNITWYTY